MRYDLSPSISVVIPVYNAVESLPSLLMRLQASLCDYCSLFEVLLVNDGSRDDSWECICELASQFAWVHGLNLMRNFGQHNALLCGIRAAKYDIIVTLDDDLQHPPEEIQKLVSELTNGADVVYGVPEQQQHGILRDAASQITKLALQSAMGAEIASKVSAFRAFRTELRDSFEHFNHPFVSIDVLLSWATTRFRAVRVRHDPRRTGESNYTFRKLVVHALNMLTGFSTFPLQIASILGFALTVFGFGVFLLVLGRFAIEGTSVPGFPFLASIIALFSGAQLFTLGIAGEYLARIHLSSQNRPCYAIRSRTDRHALVSGRVGERLV